MELFGGVFCLFYGFVVADEYALVLLVGRVLASPVLCRDGVPVVVGEGVPAVLDDVVEGVIWQIIWVEVGGLGEDVSDGLKVAFCGFERDAHDSAGCSSCMNWLKVLFPACWACVICWSVQSGCCCFR